MAERPRAEAMSASVLSAARGRGVVGPEIERLRLALDLAMEPRESLLSDDHHPAFLHPGRVALVLLRDVEDPPGRSLVPSVLLESRDPELRVASSRVEATLGRQVAEARDASPQPGAEDLAERLVTLERRAALGVLAEHLDHLRHEHLREPATPWADLVDEVERVWLPASQRLSSTLGRRYAHWLRTFRRRL